MIKDKKLKGLSDSEVIDSRKKHGENILTPPPKESLWKMFLEKFEDPMIRILLVAAFLSLLISFIHNEYAETIGIFCAIFLATGVAFWFERDAKKRFDILNQVSDDIFVKVLRNGSVIEVLRKEIVVGDVVYIETGEEIPADGELIESHSLAVDESCLTGELIIDKTTDEAHFEKEATYPSNYLMRGTKVMDGNGIMVVFKVGDATEYGQVSKKSTELSGEATPLNKQLESLAKIIGIGGFSLAIATFLALFLKDILNPSVVYTSTQLIYLSIALITMALMMSKVWLPFVNDAINLCKRNSNIVNKLIKTSLTRVILVSILFLVVCIGLMWGISGDSPFIKSSWISIETVGKMVQHFMVAVTLIVVSIPEGLPMSVTLSLALSMRRMLKTNNLVRKMHACETMGAITVICTDKTGTLTQNQMRVNSNEFFGLENNELSDNKLSNLIYEGISINTTAFLDKSNDALVKPVGNPTEGALLLWLDSVGKDYNIIRENSQIVEQLPFSTERKYMATIIDSSLQNERILYVKGAPEVILAKAKLIQTKNGVESIDSHLKNIEDLLSKYQNQAMRTLGFGYKILDKNSNLQIEDNVEDGVIFIGFSAIADPIRLDVPNAVSKCHSAGIDVKIVTGDTTATAKEIGKQIGIWKSDFGDRHIITGVEFGLLSDEEALNRVQDMKIMCRARPSDKQRLVQLLQKCNEVVAVTGDGTNDAPALNYAHVGLSMGTGTSVAKEASDITLMDDSFASIATAVMWGRSLYLNIQRFILFQLTINVTAMVIVLIGSIFGAELPLTVTQMLWVNLIMDTFAAGALASLPPEDRVMKKAPRKNSDFIITKNMGINILSVSAFFIATLLFLIYFYTTNGEISTYSLTKFFTIFVLLQMWNMFNAKAYGTGKSAFSGIKKNGSFIAVFFIILFGQVLIVNFGGDVFRTTPLSIEDWVMILCSTSAVLWIGELYRLIKKISTK